MFGAPNFGGGHKTLKLDDYFTIQCYSTIHPLPFVTIMRTVQQGALSVYSQKSSFTHLLNLIKGFFMGCVQHYNNMRQMHHWHRSKVSQPKKLALHKQPQVAKIGHF